MHLANTGLRGGGSGSSRHPELEETDSIELVTLQPTSLSEGNTSAHTAGWGNTTNPRNHNPGNFRYIVHAFSPASELMTKPMLQQVEQEAIEAEPEMYAEFLNSDYNQKILGNPDTNIFINPKKITDRVSLSLSMIDQKHTDTWGDFGYIFNVPEQNILASSPKDLGARHDRYSVYKQMKAGRQLPSADELLEQTSSTKYNELHALTSYEGSSLSISGIFFKTDEHGKPYNDSIVPILREKAQELGVPLVPINNANVSQDDFFKKLPNNMYRLRLNNQVYSLNIFGGFQVKATFQPLRHMSPDEFEEAVRILKNNNISDSEITALQNRYNEADENYHKPKIRENNNGALISIKKKIGYGSKEQTLIINDSGRAYKALSKSLREFNGEMLMNHSVPSWSPLSPVEEEEFNELINETCTQYPQRQSEIRSWAQNIPFEVGVVKSQEWQQLKKFIDPQDLC